MRDSKVTGHADGAGVLATLRCPAVARHGRRVHRGQDPDHGGATPGHDGQGQVPPTWGRGR